MNNYYLRVKKKGKKCYMCYAHTLYKMSRNILEKIALVKLTLYRILNTHMSYDPQKNIYLLFIFTLWNKANSFKFDTEEQHYSEKKFKTSPAWTLLQTENVNRNVSFYCYSFTKAKWFSLTDHSYAKRNIKQWHWVMLSDHSTLHLSHSSEEILVMVITYVYRCLR